MNNKGEVRQADPMLLSVTLVQKMRPVDVLHSNLVEHMQLLQTIRIIHVQHHCQLCVPMLLDLSWHLMLQLLLRQGAK